MSGTQPEITDTGQSVKPLTVSQPPITNYNCERCQTVVKKRKISDSPPSPKNQPSTAGKVKNQTLPISNKYSALTELEDQESHNKSTPDMNVQTSKANDNVLKGPKK